MPGEISYLSHLQQQRLPLTFDAYRVPLYAWQVIKSFGSADTERLFNRERVKRFEPIERQAQRKLATIDAAKELRELSAVPGNRLEKLHGDREGQYSIRITDRWRVCFVWREEAAHEVEIVDYH